MIDRIIYYIRQSLFSSPNKDLYVTQMENEGPNLGCPKPNACNYNTTRRLRSIMDPSKTLFIQHFYWAHNESGYIMSKCHTCEKCQIYKHGPCFEDFLFQTSVHSHRRQQSSPSHLLFIRRMRNIKPEFGQIE